MIDKKSKNRKLSDQARLEQSATHPGLPVKITVETTNSCNLRCKICQSKRPFPPQHFPLALLEKIAAETFADVTVFHPTTIGEPFCYPFFDNVIELLSKHKVMLDLTTNGTLLTTEKSRQILPLLEDVKISMDAANLFLLEAIRVGIKGESLRYNIENFIRIRREIYPERKLLAPPTCTLQMTLMKNNYSQLPAMVGLAASLGVDRLKAYHLFAFSPEMNEESLMGLQEEYNRVFETTRDLAEKQNIQVFLAEPFAIASSNPDPICQNGREQPCPLLWHELWVDLNGDVLPCANPKRMVMGNVHRQSMLDIWNSPAYRKLREGFSQRKFPSMCKGCGYRFSVPDLIKVPYDDRNFQYPYTFQPDYSYSLRWSGRTAQLVDHTRNHPELM